MKWLGEIHARVRLTAGLAGLAVVAAGALPAAASAAKPADGDVLPGRYVVVYEPSVADVDGETDARERARGFRARHRYRSAVKGFSAALSPGQVRQLREDPEVAYVSQDRAVRALGVVPLVAGEATPPTGVRRMQAATSTTARQAADAAVAVVDTGVDLTHPDLNVSNGVNCVSPGSPAADDNGHGTHVAGTIAARNNGAGVVGVAPGTKVYAVKVLDAEGSGSWSTIICGLDWVTANVTSRNVKVANLSLGGLGTNDANCGRTVGDALHQAVCRAVSARVSVVAAAGNKGWDLGDDPPDVPAAYPEVLTVTAMSDSNGLGGATGSSPACDPGNLDDQFADFSNYASRAADMAHMIAAPGVCIRSTAAGGGYTTMSGTSMATPHVAGAVALCLGEAGVAGPCAGETPAQVVQRMRSRAQAKAGAEPTYGFAGDPSRPNATGDYFGYLADVVPDTAAPQTTVASGPSGLTNDSTPTFGLASDDPGARFECRVDAAAWTSCPTAYTTATLSDGSHTVEARAVDLVGNRDASPASRTVLVDTAGPDTSLPFGPASPTKNRTPTFELASPENGASFQCRVDGGAWVACTSPHRTATLADGQHTFEARALDAAGNPDASPAAWTFTVEPDAVPTEPEASGPTPATAPAPAPAPQPTATTTANVSAGVSAPATAPVARDATAPAVAVARVTQRLRSILRTGLRLPVRCSEGCTVSAAVWLDGAAARRLGLSRGRAVRIAARTQRLASGATTVVSLRLAASARRRLERVRRVTVTARLSAVDAAGNRRAVSRRLNLVR
jgi:subtilisin family serine protease